MVTARGWPCPRCCMGHRLACCGDITPRSPQHPLDGRLAGDITMPERVARGESGDAAPDLGRRLGGGVTGRAAGASPSGSGLSRYSNMYAETEPAPP